MATHAPRASNAPHCAPSCCAASTSFLTKIRGCSNSREAVLDAGVRIVQYRAKGGIVAQRAYGVARPRRANGTRCSSSMTTGARPIASIATACISGPTTTDSTALRPSATRSPNGSSGFHAERSRRCEPPMRATSIISASVPSTQRRRSMMPARRSASECLACAGSRERRARRRHRRNHASTRSADPASGAAMAAVISAVSAAPQPATSGARTGRRMERLRPPRRAMTPIVLSIGTTQPWNVAGVGRDFVVGGEFGVRVFTAVAAVSAQDGARRHGASCHSGRRLSARSSPLCLGIPPARFASARCRRLPPCEPWRRLTVAAVAPGRRRPGLYCEPRRRARRFVPRATALRDELATSAQRRSDAEPRRGAPFFSGGHRSPRGEIAEAAAALRDRGAAAVLLKGGHLDGDPADALATAARRRDLQRTRASRVRCTAPAVRSPWRSPASWRRDADRGRRTRGARVRSGAARKALTASCVTFTRE